MRVPALHQQPRQTVATGGHQEGPCVSGQSQHDGLQVTPDYKLEDKYMFFCSVCWPVSVKPVENLFLASLTISGPLLGTRNWRREFFHSTS